MRRAAVLGLLALLCLASGLARAAPDPRVEARLQELDLRYQVDEEGEFKLLLRFEDGRRHQVYVDSATDSYGEDLDRLRRLEVRSVWAPVARYEGELPPEVARRLLEDAYGLKLGTWQTARAEGSSLVIFSVRADAAADARTLHTLIWYVAYRADQMEKELTGKDDL
jgi:hypothetical protein